MSGLSREGVRTPALRRKMKGMTDVAHPIRFGAVMSVRGAARRWAEAAREVEGAGYSTILVPDTLFAPSPFPTLAAAAASTSTLRLGTWVVSAPIRRPAEVVREVTALQELSEGRFELGVGAGRPGGDADAAALGADWGTPGERVDRVAATVGAVRDGVDPVPRIVVAGKGERMLRIAGRSADTLALPTSPTATREEVVALAARVRDVVGPRIEHALPIVGVDDELPDWVRHQLRLTPDDLRRGGAVGMLSGDLARDADALESLRDESGISYFTVPGEVALRLAPLVAALSGR